MTQPCVTLQVADLSSAWYHGPFRYSMPGVSGAPVLSIDVYASAFPSPSEMAWVLVPPTGDVTAALERVTNYLRAIGVNVRAIIIRVDSAEFTPYTRMVLTDTTPTPSCNDSVA
jgi:hypothetical protein